jgi:hypothetical protein
MAHTDTREAPCIGEKTQNLRGMWIASRAVHMVSPCFSCVASVACVAALALGCGGKSTAVSEDGGTDAPAADAFQPVIDAATDTPASADARADAADGEAGCVARVPLNHRPTETSCSSSQAGDDACLSDADCTKLGPQVPGSNTCVEGDCRIDADCGDAGFCSPSVSPGCSYPACGGFYCHTCSDTCIDDTDCPTGWACGYDTAAGHWLCVAPPSTG